MMKFITKIVNRSKPLTVPRNSSPSWIFDRNLNTLLEQTLSLVSNLYMVSKNEALEMQALSFKRGSSNIYN